MNVGMILDGKTPDGTRVVVMREDSSPEDLGAATAYGRFGVEIDGEPVKIKRVSRLRDGGTTILSLVDGREIVFLNRIGTTDRTPKLDGEPIEG
jgi:hypothetical protein